MHCPYCSHASTRVVETRLVDPGDALRRRRACEGCGERFTTYERVEATPVTVVKRDGRREQFDRQKLLRGLGRAANKRPVSETQLEELADAIAARVRRMGPEVDASLVGELSLRGLAEIDPVTGLLFASVYRNFRDLSELESELQRIRSEPVAGDDQLALDQAAPAAPIPSDAASNIGASPYGGRRGSREASRKPDAKTELTRRRHAAQP